MTIGKELAGGNDLKGQEVAFDFKVDEFFIDTLTNTISVQLVIPFKKSQYEGSQYQFICMDLHSLDTLWEKTSVYGNKLAAHLPGYIKYASGIQYKILDPKTGNECGAFKGKDLKYLRKNHSLISFQLGPKRDGVYLRSHNLDSGNLNWSLFFEDRIAVEEGEIQRDTLLFLHQIPYRVVNLVNGQIINYFPEEYFKGSKLGASKRLFSPVNSDFFLQATDSRLIKFRWEDFEIEWDLGLPADKSSDMIFQLEDSILFLVNMGKVKKANGATSNSGEPFFAGVNWSTAKPLYTKAIYPKADYILDVSWDEKKVFLAKKNLYEVYDKKSGDLIYEEKLKLPLSFRHKLRWAGPNTYLLNGADSAVKFKDLYQNAKTILSYNNDISQIPKIAVGYFLFGIVGGVGAYQLTEGTADFVLLNPVDKTTGRSVELTLNERQISIYQLIKSEPFFKDHDIIILRKGIFIFGPNGKKVARIIPEQELSGNDFHYQISQGRFAFLDGKKLKFFHKKGLEGIGN